jgi:uncharacterized protein
MLDNRPTALITGASSGIGKAFADLCAADNYDLVLVARDQAALNRTAEAIRARSKCNVTVLPYDLSDPLSPKALVSELRSRAIAVDLLINNAGSGMQGEFADADPETLLQLVNVNVLTLTYLTRLLLPGMVARGSGKILNVASIASYYPGPLTAAYNASKAYVLSLSEALHFELRDSGIAVTVLCPGPTETNFGARAGLAACPAFQQRLMDADSVARAGLDGVRKGKRVVTPGFANRLRMVPIRMMPRAILARFSRRYHSPPPASLAIQPAAMIAASPSIAPPLADAMHRSAAPSGQDYFGGR